MNTVTYSVEDNKIRLYVGRVSREDYDALRAAGFVSTPKQDCDFVATWTPTREDLAREFLSEGEDIGDEDYSATERAADRAERFEGYREKREGEAVGSADAFESGPTAFGHQSRARAERQATRHDRKRTYAVSQWAKAEYWQQRTAGVIRNALYKASASVRRGRIKTLEAEQRKHEKTREEYAARFAGWSKVATLEGADRAGVREEGGYSFTPESMTPALQLAYSLANYGGYRSDYTHPRTGKDGRSMYDLLTDATDPLTPGECAALWLANATDPTDPDSNAARWSAHYEHRLTYERAMLANEGGTAADADMVPGGFIGGRQIHKVNKSPVTGRVVSVTLKMEGDRWGNTREGFHMRAFSIERFPEGAYRAPTAEELEAFQGAKAEAKAEAKATGPKAAPLVNPTDADAERLQALWNAKALERWNEWRKQGNGWGAEFVPTAVKRMTQAEYSARSKGDYGTAETVEVCEHGHRPARKYGQNADPVPVAFKVRKTYGRTGWTGCADAVIVLTDKPQKAIPLDWSAVEAGTVQDPEAVAV